MRRSGRSSPEIREREDAGGGGGVGLWKRKGFHVAWKSVCVVTVKCDTWGLHNVGGYMLFYHAICRHGTCTALIAYPPTLSREEVVGIALRLIGRVVHGQRGAEDANGRVRSHELEVDLFSDTSIQTTVLGE